MRQITLAVTAAAVAAMLTACSGGKRTSKTNSSAGDVDAAALAGRTAVTPARSPVGAAAAAPAEDNGIKTASVVGIGSYLTDENGRSLYEFERDTKNVSTCMDECAVAWPPMPGSVATSEAPVQPSMLGAIARSDAKRQATYNGKPVYYYEDDRKAGDIEGQGKLEFGGLWYLVSPSGAAIKVPRPAHR